jgi:hypothetical protein
MSTMRLLHKTSLSCKGILPAAVEAVMWRCSPCEECKRKGAALLEYLYRRTKSTPQNSVLRWLWAVANPKPIDQVLSVFHGLSKRNTWAKVRQLA